MSQHTLGRLPNIIVNQASYKYRSIYHAPFTPVTLPKSVVVLALLFSSFLSECLPLVHLRNLLVQVRSAEVWEITRVDLPVRALSHHQRSCRPVP